MLCGKILRIFWRLRMPVSVANTKKSLGTGSAREFSWLVLGAAIEFLSPGQYTYTPACVPPPSVFQSQDYSHVGQPPGSRTLSGMEGIRLLLLPPLLGIPCWRWNESSSGNTRVERCGFPGGGNLCSSTNISRAAHIIQAGDQPSIVLWARAVHHIVFHSSPTSSQNRACLPIEYIVFPL